MNLITGISYLSINFSFGYVYTVCVCTVQNKRTEISKLETVQKTFKPSCSKLSTNFLLAAMNLNLIGIAVSITILSVLAGLCQCEPLPRINTYTSEVWLKEFFVMVLFKEWSVFRSKTDQSVMATHAEVSENIMITKTQADMIRILQLRFLSILIWYSPVRMASITASNIFKYKYPEISYSTRLLLS